MYQYSDAPDISSFELLGTSDHYQTQ